MEFAGIIPEPKRDGVIAAFNIHPLSEARDAAQRATSTAHGPGRRHEGNSERQDNRQRYGRRFQNYDCLQK